jgi:DNA-directed RNA polymerase specialized sigma24 family protein
VKGLALNTMTATEARRRPRAGDLAETDAALEAWARWAKTALAGMGWPVWTMLARVIEFGAMEAAARGNASADALQADELCELVERAVLRLAEYERKVIVSHYLHWQPGDVSARYCRMTPGQFRVVLHRARRSVRDYIEGAKLHYSKQ